MTVVAVYRYLKCRSRLLRREDAVSILKPLSGLEKDLETNLRSFFQQDYREFEIVFAARHSDDPALGVVHRLRKEFPSVQCRVLTTGNPPYPNAKVYSLDKMIKASRYDLLVMSDSDIRVGQNLLKTVVAELQDEKVDLLTCPYRAVPSHSFWSRLEAIGLNTEFLAGLLVARLVEGVRFAVGPTIVLRKKLIEDLGGFSRFGSYLAEDFVLGQVASERGYGVELSHYRVDHYIASRTTNGSVARCCGEWVDNMKHRLRWARSTRCSRRWGYLGQAFTYPLPWVLVAVVMLPWGTMELLGFTALLRAVAAWAVAGAVLHDSVSRWNFWLVPLQDMMGWIFWFFGFFGNRIEWRDRTYRLLADGRFELIEK
ncbi:MAG: ceramide glucosyltransferase [Solibacterales bacterium]|nr:ceramide glucosyltransferase [Bryobacterales bacterium]